MDGAFELGSEIGNAGLIDASPSVTFNCSLSGMWLKCTG